MQIHGTSHVHGPHGINPPHNPRLTQPQQAGQSASADADQLEISQAAEAAIRTAETGGIRHELVARIRSEIADGTYETADKLDKALDRFLDETA